MGAACHIATILSPNNEVLSSLIPFTEASPFPPHPPPLLLFSPAAVVREDVSTNTRLLIEKRSTFYSMYREKSDGRMYLFCMRTRSWSAMAYILQLYFFTNVL